MASLVESLLAVSEGRLNSNEEVDRVIFCLQAITACIANQDIDAIQVCCSSFAALAKSLRTLWQQYSSKSTLYTTVERQQLGVEIIAAIGALVHGDDQTCAEALRQTEHTAAFFALLRGATGISNPPIVVAAATGMLCLFDPMPPSDSTTVQLYLQAAQSALICSLSAPDSDLIDSECTQEAHCEVGAQGIWLLDRTVRKAAYAQIGDVCDLFVQPQSVCASDPFPSAASWPVNVMQLMFHPRLCGPRDTLLQGVPLVANGERVIDGLIPCMHRCIAFLPSVRRESELVPLVMASSAGFRVLLHHLCSVSAPIVSGGYVMAAAILRMLGPACLAPAVRAGSSRSASLREEFASSASKVHRDLILETHLDLVEEVLDQIALPVTPADDRASSISLPAGTGNSIQKSILELIVDAVVYAPASTSHLVPGAQLAVLAFMRDAVSACSEALAGQALAAGAEDSRRALSSSSSSSAATARCLAKRLFGTVSHVVRGTLPLCDADVAVARGELSISGRPESGTVVMTAAVHAIVCIIDTLANTCTRNGFMNEAAAIVRDGISILLSWYEAEMLWMQAVEEIWLKMGHGERQLAFPGALAFLHSILATFQVRKLTLSASEARAMGHPMHPQTSDKQKTEFIFYSAFSRLRTVFSKLTHNIEGVKCVCICMPELFGLTHLIQERNPAEAPSVLLTSAMDVFLDSMQVMLRVANRQNGPRGQTMQLVVNSLCELLTSFANASSRCCDKLSPTLAATIHSHVVDALSLLADKHPCTDSCTAAFRASAPQLRKLAKQAVVPSAGLGPGASETADGMKHAGGKRKADRDVEVALVADTNTGCPVIQGIAVAVVAVNEDVVCCVLNEVDDGAMMATTQKAHVPPVLADVPELSGHHGHSGSASYGAIRSGTVGAGSRSAAGRPSKYRAIVASLGEADSESES